MVLAQSLCGVVLVASLLILKGGLSSDQPKGDYDNPICPGSVDVSICGDPYCHCMWSLETGPKGEPCWMVRAICF